MEENNKFTWNVPRWLVPLAIIVIQLGGFGLLFLMLSKNIRLFNYGNAAPIEFLNAWLAFLSLLLTLIGLFGAFYIFSIRDKLKELEYAENKVNVAILLNEAGEKHRDKEYKKAIEDYDIIIGLDPKHAKAYSSRGGSYYALKDYYNAKKDFKKAIELDSKLSNAYKNLGEIIYAESDPNFYKIKNYNLDKTSATSYYDFGKLKYEIAFAYDQAIEHYNDAIEKDKYNRIAYLYRSVVMYQLFGSKDERFRRDRDKAMELDNYLKKDSDTDITSFFGKTISKNNTTHNLYDDYTYEEKENGLVQESLNDFSEAIKLMPKLEKDKNIKRMMNFLNGLFDK